MNEIDIGIINFYEKKYAILQQELFKLEEKEPAKIFKNNHKVWEEKKEILEQELEKYSTKLANKYKEIEGMSPR